MILWSFMAFKTPILEVSRDLGGKTCIYIDRELLKDFDPKILFAMRKGDYIFPPSQISVQIKQHKAAEMNILNITRRKENIVWFLSAGTQKMKEELKQTESLMTFFKNLAICSDESGVSTESLEHQTSPQSKAEKEEAETAPLSQRLMSKLSKTDSSVQSHTASPAASLPQLDALSADRCSYMSDGQFDLQFSFTLTDCSLVAPNHLNLTTQSSSLFDSPIPEKNQAVDLDSSHISIFSSEESVWEKEVISTCSQKSATQHVFYPASANDSFCKRQEKLSGFDSPKHEFPPCKPIHILHSDDLCVSASATNNSTTSVPNSLGKEKTQSNTPMTVEEPRNKPEHCDEHLPLFQRLRQRLPKETQNELAKLTSFENLDTKAFHF